MLGMQAGEVNLMQQDQLDAIYGILGSWVTLHYVTESGTPDVYSNPQSTTPQTLRIRCFVDPILRRDLQLAAIEDQKWDWKQAGEYVLTFDTVQGLPLVDGGRNMTVLNFNSFPQLWFDVEDENGSSLVQLTPVMKPPFGAGKRPQYVMSGRRFTQEVLVRPRT